MPVPFVIEYGIEITRSPLKWCTKTLKCSRRTLAKLYLRYAVPELVALTIDAIFNTANEKLLMLDSALSLRTPLPVESQQFYNFYEDFLGN